MRGTSVPGLAKGFYQFRAPSYGIGGDTPLEALDIEADFFLKS